MVDQSNFILMESIIYSVLTGFIFDQIQYFYEYSLMTKYIIILFKQTFVPHMGLERQNSFKEVTRGDQYGKLTVRHHVFRNYVSPN